MRPPCPRYILDREDGRRIYCEQGAEGHAGTCCGSRERVEYLRLVRDAGDPMRLHETQTCAHCDRPIPRGKGRAAINGRVYHTRCSQLVER